MLLLFSDLPRMLKGFSEFILVRLTLIFLLAFNINSNAKGFPVNVSISKKNASFLEVFREIRNQTGYTFVYHEAMFDQAKRITLTISNASLNQVLEECFKDQPVTFTILNKTVFIKEKEEVAENKKNYTTLAPTGDIAGIVTNEKGEPLQGVSVVISGTKIGTTTKNDGRFVLAVSNSADVSLEVSYIGYQTKVVNVGKQTDVNIILEKGMTGLQDVVVVGYGTQKKVNMTGAISTVKFDNELNNRPITNATQALSGKVTGVWVSQNSGKPGGDEAQLRVRGWGTMNNSSALIIIDGVEGSFNQINPNDIESMSVLKDAASAAIYGSKAANGVILITTKMGRKNEKMQVNLNSYVGQQSLGRSYDMIDNSAENMRLSNQALINDGSSPVYPDYLISAFENANDPYKYPNTNWNKTLFRKAIIHQNNLSIRGGSAQSSSFLSANYMKQDGIVPNTETEKYGIRANVESNVKDWLKVTGRVNYSRQISNEPYADITYGSLGRVFEMLQGAAPFIAPFTSDGKFGSVQAIDNRGNLLYDNRNPLIDAANGSTRTATNAIVVNTSAEIKLTNDLRLNTTFATTANWVEIDKYNQSVFGYTDGGIETITKNFNREGLEMNRSNVSTINNNLYSTLNYHKSFSQLHDFSAIAGMQLENTEIKNLFARSTGAPQEGLTQIDAGTSGIQGRGNKVALKMLSYFGRLNYSLADKYLFEVDLRADASSRFKKGKRWGIFPGFSAGWRLSEEKFIQNLNLFSNLKLRGSWGQLGNQNISGYWPYLTVIAQSYDLSYSSGGTFVPGAAVTSLTDENISWETASTLDIGADISFLNNRINIEADYFKKNTAGIIVQLPIPGILGGVNPPFENVGQMLNNGFEFAVNYESRKTKRDQFSYNLGVNLTYIKNQVTKFRENAPDQLYLIREGYSYNSLYGYKSIGIFQSDDEAYKYMYANGFKPKAGNLKFEDVNHDGKLGFEDKQGLGNTIPKFTYGLTSNFKFKGFDLNVLLQGIGGVNAYTQNSFTSLSYENRVISKAWRNAWTPQNTNTDMPRLRYSNTWDQSQSSFWVHDITFVKLRNIQLGYGFPAKMTSKLGLQKIYIYANAQNVFTIVNDKYQGYDPERNTFNSGNNMYPVPRIISIGANVNF